MNIQVYDDFFHIISKNNKLSSCVLIFFSLHGGVIYHIFRKVFRTPNYRTTFSQSIKIISCYRISLQTEKSITSGTQNFESLCMKSPFVQNLKTHNLIFYKSQSNFSTKNIEKKNVI